MLDPFSVSAAFVGTLQFVLQLKTYLHEKKKRKRQEQDQQQQQQQQQQQHQHLMYPQFSIPSSPITYCICYHIYQAYPNHNVQYYMQSAPYSYPLPLQPPNLYYHNNHTHSRSLRAPEPSSPHHDPSLTNFASNPSYDWLGLLGGHMELLHHQQAPHNTHETLGMRTGACIYNDRSSSYHHWKSLQEERSQGLQRSTIAVVDWSRGNIDMFMEIGGAYFRNYRISRCDVAVFAYLFKEREVFSGEIKEQKLERFNKEMKMVEMQRSGVRSTNSWTSLGIYEESEEMKEVMREEASFIQTVRGAVFGLVCCLYDAPSDLNVDMEAAHLHMNGHLDIVRVNTHQQPCHILKRHSCFFSVFSFADHGWAAQDILLG